MPPRVWSVFKSPGMIALIAMFNAKSLFSGYRQWSTVFKIREMREKLANMRRKWKIGRKLQHSNRFYKIKSKFCHSLGSIYDLSFVQNVRSRIMEISLRSVKSQNRKSGPPFPHFRASYSLFAYCFSSQYQIESFIFHKMFSIF